VPFLETTLDLWNRIFAVNATGTYLVTKAFLPEMIEAGFGRVVTMSSVSAQQGGGVYGKTPYSAAKAAVIGFTRSLARELGPTGMTVNVGEVQCQGYVGQALGFADVLSVIYKDLAQLRPEDPEWEDRDRVLLSRGHYAIALYAALAEAGTLDVAELETYESDDSRLPISGMSTYTPGMEISGGSLGHGLGVAVGIALGLRHQGKDARVINLMSDGELDEGSTWEAAMAASHHHLGRLLCVVDMNGLQADGPTDGVLRIEPVEAKWAAFGWRAVRCDGNDIAALLQAFDSVPAEDDRPAVVVCDTRIGRGVTFLETREKAHFIRIDEHEWELAREALRGTATGRRN
jgi:transketolase